MMFHWGNCRAEIERSKALMLEEQERYLKAMALVDELIKEKSQLRSELKTLNRKRRCRREHTIRRRR
jgi:hypothetical protein